MQFLRNAQGKTGTIRLSVRELVEFLRRTGDLDDRVSARAEKEAMLAGTRIHKKLQKEGGKEYQSEVYLRYEESCPDYSIQLEGRADGVIRKENEILIDEIKGVYRDVRAMEEPVPVHLAQAMCYAAMLSFDNPAALYAVRMTYVSIETEEVRRIERPYTPEALQDWFRSLLKEFRTFTDLLIRQRTIRDESIKTLAFPYPFREGQKELAQGVYRSILREKFLYLEAPTGIGKTLAVLYPSVKAVGERLADRIFYLSARNVAQAAAEEAFRILREKGLRFRSVRIIGKERICFLKEPSCNADACPYAKAYFEKLPDALLAVLAEAEHVDAALLRSTAEVYKVCPYELSLAVSSFCDAVICDYNYVFDPTVRLRRFFGEHTKKENIFLIDEAHNLVDRGRSMFSAAIVKEEILAAKRLVKDRYPKIEKAFQNINAMMLKEKRSLEEEEFSPERNYKLLPDDGGLAGKAHLAAEALDALFAETKNAELKESLLEIYFVLRAYEATAENLDDSYVCYSAFDEAEHFLIRLFNTNPSKNIRSALESAKCAVFFSATLLPIRYYRSLLGAKEEDYAIYAVSPFQEEKRGVFIASDVSTRYARRTEGEYRRIASHIRSTALAKKGNYLVFFPSHRMMRQVFSVYREAFDDPEIAYVMQPRSMDDLDREIFLENFEEAPKDRSLLGFCVMGGLFSEGIDLPGDRLIGAIVVGCGLPQVGCETEILRIVYDEEGNKGFDYAYRYPGMNKVLQAAGRVIRSTEDKGVIVLLDDRFLEMEYQALFPREWTSYTVINKDNALAAEKAFWEKTEEPRRER